MSYTLGKFKATDVFTMATLLSKVGLGKVADGLGRDNIMKIITENKVFLLFKNIFIPEESIKNATHDCIPLNAFPTSSIVRNLSKKSEIIKIIVREGKTIPSVEATDPQKPLTLYPI